MKAIVLLPIALLLLNCGAHARSKTFGLKPVKSPTASSLTDSKFAAWVGQSNSIFDGTGCSNVSASQATSFVKDSRVRDPALTQSDKANLSAVTTGNVVVVSDLRWCGREYASSVAGCEGAGPIILVADPYAGMTLINELGHEGGLHHTWQNPDCPVPPPAGSGVTDAKFKNVMFCRRHLERRRLTTTQCTTFANSRRLDATPTKSPAEPARELLVAGNTINDSTTQFLTFGFDLGTPLAAIQALDEEQIAEVRRVLHHRDLSPLWSNAAIVIGIRGEKGDVSLLVDLFNAAKNGSEPEDRRTLTSSAFGLGILSARLGGPSGDEALAFLLTQMNPQQLDEDRARAVLKGVAYSGNIAATRAVLDILVAKKQIDLKTATPAAARAITNYVRNREFPESAANILAQLPNVDATLFINLASTATSVRANGVLYYLDNPTNDPSSLSKLETLPRALLGDRTRKALELLGVAELPGWKVLLQQQL